MMLLTVLQQLDLYQIKIVEMCDKNGEALSMLADLFDEHTSYY